MREQIIKRIEAILGKIDTASNGVMRELCIEVIEQIEKRGDDGIKATMRKVRAALEGVR